MENLWFWQGVFEKRITLQIHGMISFSLSEMHFLAQRWTRVWNWKEGENPLFSGGTIIWNMYPRVTESNIYDRQFCPLIKNPPIISASYTHCCASLHKVSFSIHISSGKEWPPPSPFTLQDQRKKGGKAKCVPTCTHNTECIFDPDSTGPFFFNCVLHCINFMLFPI